MVKLREVHLYRGHEHYIITTRQKENLPEREKTKKRKKRGAKE